MSLILKSFAKKTFFLLLMVVFFLYSTARADEWKISLRRAKQEDKPVILYFFTSTTLLKPNGQQIIRIPGYIEKDDFKKLLAFVRGKYYKVMNLKEFLRKHARVTLLQDRPEAAEIS